jgi:hypothetical protein
MDMDAQQTGAGEKRYHDSTLPSRDNSLETGQADIAGRVDKASEKRLVRKLDLHLIPLVMSLYLFSFLDR